MVSLDDQETENLTSQYYANTHQNVHFFIKRWIMIKRFIVGSYKPNTSQSSSFEESTAMSTWQHVVIFKWTMAMSGTVACSSSILILPVKRAARLQPKLDSMSTWTHVPVNSNTTSQKIVCIPTRFHVCQQRSPSHGRNSIFMSCRQCRITAQWSNCVIMHSLTLLKYTTVLGSKKKN